MHTVQPPFSSVAPRTFEPGFIVISYIVSFIGSLSTLELLKLRTAGRGLYNIGLLVGSAITMGGIAIWSMHFIGNRAILLWDDEPELQLAYSPGFTALSFFIPVFVLFLAYLMVGNAEDRSLVSKLRIAVGGLLAGVSVCGMHYLGNTSVTNYELRYSKGYVGGACVIAVISSMAALSVFFVIKRNFSNAWWKRVLLALVLATGVSGMHWTAVVGTYYVYISTDMKDQVLDRQNVAVVTIVLSVAACLLLVAFAVIAGRGFNQRRKRARRIVVMSTVFDNEGKLMVLPDGNLPEKIITELFADACPEDSFGPGSPVFRSMYRTSRHWQGISDKLGTMQKNVRAYRSTKPLGVTYSNNYRYQMLREMFCLAAKDLAAFMRTSFCEVGVLHDTLIYTGERKCLKSDPEAGCKGMALFLVRHVSKAEATRLTENGFRFAAVPTVLGIIAASMRTSTDTVTSLFCSMVGNTSPYPPRLSPGVYLSAFILRQETETDYGILVQRRATHHLPCLRLQSAALTEAHLRFLRQYTGKSVKSILNVLRRDGAEAAAAAGIEEDFAQLFLSTLDNLSDELTLTFFASAVMEPTPIYRDGNAVMMIVFSAIVPFAFSTSPPSFAFRPVHFFSVQQRCYENSPDHDIHARFAFGKATITRKKILGITKRRMSRSTECESIVSKDGLEFGEQEEAQVDIIEGQKGDAEGGGLPVVEGKTWADVILDSLLAD